MYKTHGLYTMDLIKFNLFNDSSNWKRDFYTFKLIATLKKLERKKKMIKCMKVATMQSHWSHRGLTKSFLVFSGAVRFEYWPKGGYLLQNHCAKRNLLLCQVISATHAASYSILTLPLYFSFKTSINLSYYCHKEHFVSEALVFVPIIEVIILLLSTFFLQCLIYSVSLFIELSKHV